MISSLQRWRVRAHFAVAAFVAGAVLAVPPARAEVEKTVVACDQGLCPFFKPLIVVPDGWEVDLRRSDVLRALILVPANDRFETAPALIYALAIDASKGETIESYEQSVRRDWGKRAPEDAVREADPIPRKSGNGEFRILEFAAPGLPDQGFEIVAVTSDEDKDKNSFVVSVVLTARTQAGLDAARKSFRAILEAY